MAFTADEVGLASGEPVELYTFIGTLNTYRMTTADEDIISNGNLFAATAGLSRRGIENGTQDDDLQALEIGMPYDHPLAVEYAYNVAPPSLEFTLDKAHRNDLNDTRRLWTGDVTGFSVKGDQVSAQVPTDFSRALSQPLPAPRYQAPCNHLLYGDFCMLDENAVENAEITAVDSLLDSLTIVVPDLVALAFAELPAGELVVNSTGERRGIATATSAGGFTTLGINFPFHSIALTDAVTIRRGCNHAMDHCDGRFDNSINFGGFNAVPNRNPSSDRL